MSAIYEPLANPTPREIASRLSEMSFDGTAVAERNDYANRLLAWAETVSPTEFEKVRALIVATELAINGREWARLFPEEGTDLGVLKQHAILQEMTKATMGRRKNQSYEEFLGPDIPLILDQAFRSLVETKQERRPGS